MSRASLRTARLVAVLVLCLSPYFFWSGQTSALLLTHRSVSLSTPTPSATASETFQLTPGSNSTAGSIVFQYCTNSPLFDVACVPPAGLSLSAAALSQQTGNTGFSIDAVDSTATRLVISQTPAALSTIPSSYTFSNTTNPSTSNETTYIRISTYASTDGTGSYIDNGAVAFSTSAGLSVGATVPPFLSLCVGVTVASDCSQTAGNSVDLGVLSAQAARTGTSQFAASTNSGTGYAAYILGTTMTSGNNVIPAAALSANRPGIPEFGINLRQNTNPAVGSDPDGSGTASPVNGFDSPNLFSFEPGSMIAGSSTSTAYSRMTISYVTNVNASQPAGIYSTTLTYLVSAQF